MGLEKIIERVEGSWAKKLVIDEAMTGVVEEVESLIRVSRVRFVAGLLEYLADGLEPYEYEAVHSLDPGGELSKYATPAEVERGVWVARLETHIWRPTPKSYPR